jgi:hypothetical protein
MASERPGAFQGIDPPAPLPTKEFFTDDDYYPLSYNEYEGQVMQLLPNVEV